MSLHNLKIAEGSVPVGEAWTVMAGHIPEGRSTVWQLAICDSKKGLALNAYTNVISTGDNHILIPYD